MTPEEHIDRLDQRRRYLDARIAAKKSVGWETIYDQSERDALAWILSIVTEPVESITVGCPHPEEKRRASHNMGQEPEFICFACGETVKGVA
jgi:hypothetical protein